ncbi:hypothetical protein D3C79_606240 [compost metagenome]
MSRRNRSAAIQRASSRTSRVTAAVTLGLPSRSPPIHEAKRIGAASSGRRRPVASSRALSTLRKWLGMACHSECSITAKPHLASSTGVGRVRRISSVCQASAISRRRRSRTCSRSPGVRSRWSWAASWPAMASYFWIRVRRATSVGCAVSTSWMSSLANCRARASLLCPACFRRASSSGSTRASNGSGWSASRRRIN